MLETLTLAPAVVTYCAACEDPNMPDGKCYNVGACPVADDTATRGAAGSTAKFAVPAAWNVRGGVD